MIMEENDSKRQIPQQTKLKTDKNIRVLTKIYKSQKFFQVSQILPLLFETRWSFLYLTHRSDPPYPFRKPSLSNNYKDYDANNGVCH